MQDEDEQPREKTSPGAAFFHLPFAHLDLFDPIVNWFFSYYGFRRSKRLTSAGTIICRSP